MSRSLRIALLVNPFHSRKGESHPSALSRELLGRGHVVRAFGSKPGAIPQSGTEPSVDGGVVPEDGFGLSGFNPDVILAYDAVSPTAWLGARHARKLRVPLVLVEEGAKTVGGAFERFMRVAGGRVWGGYVRRCVDAVLALDPVAMEQMVEEGFAQRDVRLIRPGVDLTEFRPGLTSHLPGQHGVRGRILLYVGHVEDGRGLDILVSAFAKTVGRREGWSLVFAGDGGARPKLRAQVDRLGVGARVHWTRRPRREELPGLFGSSTLLALPALDDNFASHVVMKALACGLPVVASNVTRLSDLIEPDGNGLLAAPGDLPSWVEALTIAAGGPERRRRWGIRARAFAEENASWPRIAGEVETLLSAICERHARQASPRAEQQSDEGEARLDG